MLPLNELSVQETSGITLNALAIPGTAFHAYVTRGYLYSDKPVFTEVYNEDSDTDNYYYQQYMHSFWGEMLSNSVSSVRQNFKNSLLPNATVEVLVNDSESYLMRYDAEKLCYLSDYVPEEGDRIEVQVEAPDGQKTTATAEIPRKQRIEVLSAEREERALNSDFLEASHYTGYVAKLKLNISDPGNESNFYRLKIRCVGDAPSSLLDGYRYVYDYYTSGDLIFRDEQLAQKWGGWDACFSDVFDDHLFDGREYTFDVEAYVASFKLATEEIPYYVVELQSISEDYYWYLKSIMRYRISTSDVLNEGIYIHSNNKGGWGVLGAMDSERHTLYWNNSDKQWVEE